MRKSKNTKTEYRDPLILDVLIANNPNLPEEKVRQVGGQTVQILTGLAVQFQKAADHAQLLKEKGYSAPGMPVPAEPDWLDVAKWLKGLLDPTTEIAEVEYTTNEPRTETGMP